MEDANMSEITCKPAELQWNYEKYCVSMVAGVLCIYY